MPVPASAIGSAAHGFRLDPSSSGVRTNSDAADDATGNVTGAQLSRLGRLTGYELDYADPAARALERQQGLLDIATAVEAYHDPAAAERGLSFWRRDELVLKTFAVPRLGVSVHSFPVRGVGPRSYSLLLVLTARGAPALYDADVSFASGSLIGTV